MSYYVILVILYNVEYDVLVIYRPKILSNKEFSNIIINVCFICSNTSCQTMYSVSIYSKDVWQFVL